MQIAVASGKGGTGKTTVAVNLAVAASVSGLMVRLLDCDVEEPDAHIFLSPEITGREPVDVMVPKVNDAKCSLCGTCGETCAFHAILVSPKRVMVFPELCHGCGACTYLCGDKCIEEIPRSVGVVEEGVASVEGREVEFAQGVLFPGEALAAPVVKKAREKARAGSLTVVDSPPGTSCTMVNSVKGCDLCLLVTEPTPFGLHDLELAYETVRKLKVRIAVVINRCDIGDDRIDRFCSKRGIPVLARIPLDKDVATLCADGRVLAASSERYARLFRALSDEAIRCATRDSREPGDMEGAGKSDGQGGTLNDRA